MKNASRLLLLSLVVISNNALAENSWWQDALDVFTTPSSETTNHQASNQPSLNEIDRAFKEALRIGSQNVVNQLGVLDGFNGDPSIHIPLPDELNTVKSILDKVGMAMLMDDLEIKMNRAAEDATPKAKQLFMNAINEMSFDDVKRIYSGPKDSATIYFKEKMSPILRTEMRPLITESLSAVGAIQAYDTMIGEYQSLPFVPDVKSNLIDYVLDEGINGIFYYLAQQEADIREDPVKQTTQLLKDVFGPIKQ